MKRWMIVADDEPGVTFDLGWHHWTRAGAQRLADERNASLRADYGDDYRDTVWYVARVGDFPMSGEELSARCGSE